MAGRARLVVGIIIIALAVIVTEFIPYFSSRGEKLDDLAGSPWPMYQHDPQHTGQSPFLLPRQQPELIWSIDRLWTDALPYPTCGLGGITVDQSGRLIISLCGEVRRFDPITRQTDWIAQPGGSSSTPLIGADGSIYIGGGVTFNKISPTGAILWTGLLDDNFAFNSSAVFGSDGNIYFVHDGLWSVTPDGDLRWYVPYGTGYGYSHASPAVGPDGLIYTGANGAHVCAYTTSGSTEWCFSNEIAMDDDTPSIASDGTVYIAGFCDLYAINPSGSLKWTFTADEANTNLCIINNHKAIAADGSIYFSIFGEVFLPQIYAVDAEGHLKWKVELPINPTSGGVGNSPTPFVLDRSGNIFLCAGNSYCYAISPQGSIIWQYEFPLVDSIIKAGGLQPLLAADGLLYIVDNRTRLYAFADADLYPQLTSTTRDLYFAAEPGAPIITANVAVSSTIAPITYTVAYTPTEWLNVSPITSTTPSEFVVSLDPSSLSIGDYRSQITIKPYSQPGKWLSIPVGLSVGVTRTSLPMVFSDYQTPDRILYRSSWFNRIQYASIDQDGKNRITLSTDLPLNFESMVYSPDRRKVAFQHYTDNKYKIRVLDTGNGQQLLEIESNGFNWWPTWSPDSCQLMFISMRDDANGEIYRINLDGSNLTRLTYNSINEAADLYWSPNGEQVAVKVGWRWTYLMNPDGSNFRDTFPAHFWTQPLGWSPDGRFLLVKVRGSGDTFQLWSYDSLTGSFSSLGVPLNLQSPASWSPDGKKIAYVYTPQYYYTNDVYIIDADGSDQFQIVHDGYEDAGPSWSPDGIWLAFAGRMSNMQDNPNWDIFVVRRDGARLSQITHNMQGDSIPYWEDR